jgi:hypothetical protein
VSVCIIWLSCLLDFFATSTNQQTSVQITRCPFSVVVAKQIQYQFYAAVEWCSISWKSAQSSRPFSTWVCMNFCLYLPYFLLDFDEIWCKRSTNNAVENCHRGGCTFLTVISEIKFSTVKQWRSENERHIGKVCTTSCLLHLRSCFGDGEGKIGGKGRLGIRCK